jgi:hypothetical protein
MIHGMPDTTIRYIACFLTADSVVPIIPFNNETTKSIARETIRDYASNFPKGTRFCLKRVQTDYLEVEV